jgi:hypothetical protein
LLLRLHKLEQQSMNKTQSEKPFAFTNALVNPETKEIVDTFQVGQRDTTRLQNSGK